ncbi:infB [Symbiodinium sp. CCMP2456]|nr:infB [Symbiodinium sp. CCMP2456]
MDADLFHALERVLTRARRDPSGIIDRVSTVIEQLRRGNHIQPTRAEKRAWKAKLRRETAPHHAPKAPRTWADVAKDGGHHTQPEKPSAKGKGKGKGKDSPRVTPAPHRDQGKPVNRQPDADVQGWRLDPGIFGVVTFGKFKHMLEKQLDVSQVKYIVARNVLDVEKLQNAATLFDYKAKAKQAVILVAIPDGEAYDVKQVVNLPATDEGERCNAGVFTSSTSTFTAPQRELHTIRATIPQDFIDSPSYEVAKAGPHDYTVRYLGIKLHSSENWRRFTDKDEECLVGYLKLETKDVTAALKLSGKAGIFLDGLAKNRTEHAPAVKWVDREDRPGTVYLKEVRKLANGAPLAYRRGGGRALGWRLPRGEEIKDTFTWRVKGVPGYWLEEDVIAALEGANFTDISVTSRGEWKRPWLVKMDQVEKSGERLNTLSVRAGNVVLLLERTASRRQAAAQSFAVPAKSKSKSSEAGKPKETTRRPLDNAADADMLGGDAEETDQKRRKLTAQSPPANGPTTGDWFELVECGDAGHCFYNVIAAGYAISEGEDMATFKKAIPGRGKGLRKTIAETVEKHPDDYRQWWEPPKELTGTDAEKKSQHEERIKQEDGEPATDFEGYIRTLWRPNRWADEIAWRVAAEKLQTIIVACHGDPGKATHFTAIGNPKAMGTIFICYEAGHFTLVRPRAGRDYPAEWQKYGRENLEMEVSVPRGGGTTACNDDDGSVRTSRSWLAPSEPQDNRSVRTSISWMQPEPPVQSPRYEPVAISGGATALSQPSAAPSDVPAGDCERPEHRPETQRANTEDSDAQTEAASLASLGDVQTQISWLPKHEAGSMRTTRRRLSGKQARIRPDARQTHGAKTFTLHELPAVPVVCVLRALRAEGAKQRKMSIPEVIADIRRLGGTA